MAFYYVPATTLMVSLRTRGPTTAGAATSVFETDCESSSCRRHPNDLLTTVRQLFRHGPSSTPCQDCQSLLHKVLIIVLLEVAPFNLLNDSRSSAANQSWGTTGGNRHHAYQLVIMSQCRSLLTSVGITCLVSRRTL